MRKNLLFLADSGRNWMGGIYYIKNQIGQLLKYEPARKNLNIYLYVTEENFGEYKNLCKYENVHFIRVEKLRESILCKLGNRYCEGIDTDIIYLVFRYRIAYIFPYFPRGKNNQRFLLRKSISWIADFQHIHYPQFFSKHEYQQREKKYFEIARKHNKLVLSSHDAYRDFTEKYGDKGKEIYVIPFCSMLDKQDVIRDEITQTKDKYGVEGDYFIVCNQFWQHKNHMIVFEALSQMVTCEPDAKIICTGNMSDYRNRDYIAGIKSYIEKNDLGKAVLLLGMIPKKDQIQLMKGAIAVIQPSLFEGWGTVVEDAKTLGKRVLLSDISVHHEQKNSLCTIFNPNDADELANKMQDVWEQREDSMRKCCYCVQSAKKYGKLFYEMVCS